MEGSLKMQTLIIGLGVAAILGIVGLWASAWAYVQREAQKDAESIAEYRANLDTEDSAFWAQVDDWASDDAGNDAGTGQAEVICSPQGLEEWLVFDEEEYLTRAYHEYHEEFDRMARSFRHKLWAITEGTVEWSQAWEDELTAMLEKGAKVSV